MGTTLVLLIAVTLFAASCGEAADDPTGSTTTTPTTTTPTTTTTTTRAPVQQGDLARADVPRATATDSTPAEIAGLVAGDREFAFDLFRIVAADGENTFLSPYSISTAITMTLAGARGTTAAEMADVLRLGLEPDRVHTVRNELDLQIATVPESSIPGDEREPMQIQIANSLWGQAGYPFLDEFLVLLAESYDAGMNVVDFANAAEEARRTINTWVEEQTEGRIVDLIPEGVITGLTRLVLVNAIWFKASWAEQFDPAATADGVFVTLAGGDKTVPFMHGGGMLEYARGDGYELVRVAYAGDASMVILVPERSRFEEVTARLDAAFLDAAINGVGTRDVDLALPKFEFTSEFSLRSALQELGMVEAFNPPGPDSGADFRGINGTRELFVQEVVHQAFVAVDETGTEAAAATSVIVGLTSVGDEPVQLTIDRPFVFLIEHRGTGEILFLGQVTDPS